MTQSPLSFLAAAERETIASEMLECLRRHVTGAWFPRCIDRGAGGFYCDFDRHWNLSGPQRRMLEFQARQTRTAARMALAFPGESQWAEAALHGYRYLRDVMWDRQYGGWYWMMGRDGAALENETKHSHSTAYAFQACALVHAATGEPGALDLAREGFEWFHRHAHDDVHGGYLNWMQRDGKIITPSEVDASDPLGHEVGLKDVNVHGDWIEALTSFLEIQPDAGLQAHLQTLVDLFVKHFVSDQGSLYFVCYANWRPEPALERYGFHLQAAHRLPSASPFLQNSQTVVAVAEGLFDHAISRSWAEPAGFWYAGPAGPPYRLEGESLLVRRRAWWVQFEGLRSLFLHAGRDNFKGRHYATLACQQWEWMRDQLCDAESGGIYNTFPGDLPACDQPRHVADNGTALRKGDIWKDASHDADGLLACIQILRGKPGVATGVS